MIVVMKPDATALQIEHMASHITSLGLKPQVIHGTHQTVIAALGEEVPGLTQALEPGEGVEKVLPIMAPYKRASSELKRERTVVKTRGLEIGGTRVAVIAGPCSVESEEQIVGLARELKALGARLALVGRTPEKLDRVKEELGGDDAFTFAADLREEDQVKNAVDVKLAEIVETSAEQQQVEMPNVEEMSTT